MIRVYLSHPYGGSKANRARALRWAAAVLDAVDVSVVASWLWLTEIWFEDRKDDGLARSLDEAASCDWVLLCGGPPGEGGKQEIAAGQKLWSLSGFIEPPKNLAELLPAEWPRRVKTPLQRAQAALTEAGIVCWTQAGRLWAYESASARVGWVLGSVGLALTDCTVQRADEGTVLSGVPGVALADGGIGLGTCLNAARERLRGKFRHVDHQDRIQVYRVSRSELVRALAGLCVLITSGGYPESHWVVRPAPFALALPSLDQARERLARYALQDTPDGFRIHHCRIELDEMIRIGQKIVQQLAGIPVDLRWDQIGQGRRCRNLYVTERK